MKKDLLSINDLSKLDVERIFKLTDKLKNKQTSDLKGKNIALIFQKPSTRTKVSFEVAINQLGGNAISLNWNELQLGREETVEDTARVLERYVDGIVARVFSHEDLVKMARISKVSFINGLSDFEHPCQAISDLYTINQKFGSFKDLKLAYVGDGNNVCNSLILASSMIGLNISVATPKGYEPSQLVLKQTKFAKNKINLTHNPIEAVKNAQIVYTDTWVSMHQEKERVKRLKVFKSFQVNKNLVSYASRNYVFMHDLPAKRGLEAVSEIIDGPHSIVFQQAENRLHVQKGLLYYLLK